MNLDFLNDLANQIEKNEGVKSFLNELQNFLSSVKIEKGEVHIQKEDILAEIKDKRNVSLISENKIRNKKDEILEEYSSKGVDKNELTEEIRNLIYESANQILDEQDEKLREYRKEGHLYEITEDRNDRIYLWDLTDKPDIEMEEVDFPKELLSSVSEGTILRYENGRYIVQEEDEV